MVPRTIAKGLARLRRRERLLRASWGAARWLAMVLAVLALACAGDWLIDRFTETPLLLRGLMLIGQVILWGTLALFLVLRPMLARLSNSRLALWVERATPGLGHRLISAVQLNQPGARTEGMSQELIGVVTREAEEVAGRLDFPAAADHRRLTRSTLLAVPTLALASLPFVLMPGLTLTLLARQFLQDREIPRSVYLRAEVPGVLPSGEEVLLRIRAFGEGVSPELVGEVLVYPDHGPREVYELTYEKPAGTGASYFVARLRSMSVDFSFRALLADGRLPRPVRVHLEPRPVLVSQAAWLVLPEYCGLLAGKPYEVPQERGDVVGHPGLSARVQVKVQKPVREAVLELLGTPYPDLSWPTGQSAAQAVMVEALSVAGTAGLLASGSGPLDAVSVVGAGRNEVVLRRLRQTFPEGKDAVSWSFDLRPTETGYRVKVLDEYGFDNRLAPSRAVTVIPERSPKVALLRERFLPSRAFRTRGPEEDFEVDGMPVPIDSDGKPGPIRIAYKATGPYGLGSARLRYRVLKKVEGSQQEPPVAEAKWGIYLLNEVPPSRKRGRFDQGRGVFRNTEAVTILSAAERMAIGSLAGQPLSPDRLAAILAGPAGMLAETMITEEDVPFHAVPLATSQYLIGGVDFARPQDLLPRPEGGGHFDFETSDLLLNAKGGRLELEPGDQIEFFVEVFNRNPERSEAVIGRSETRTRTFVTGREFRRWMFDTLQEESRLRELERRQRGVFDAK